MHPTILSLKNAELENNIENVKATPKEKPKSICPFQFKFPAILFLSVVARKSTVIEFWWPNCQLYKMHTLKNKLTKKLNLRL